MAEDDVILIPSKPLFYQTFIDIVNSADEIDPEIQSSVQTVGFTNTLKEINKSGILTYELVTEIAPYLKKMLCKPQRLLADTEDYYVAEDELLSLYYICYRWLLMLDFDYPTLKPEEREKELKNTLDGLPKIIRDIPTYFRVYSSRNGYHVFLLSHKMERGSREAIQLMLDCKSDPYYIILSYLRGWSVRISSKFNEPSADKLYNYVCDYGSGIPLDECIAALDAHLQLSSYI